MVSVPLLSNLFQKEYLLSNNSVPGSMLDVNKEMHSPVFMGLHFSQRNEGISTFF